MKIVFNEVGCDWALVATMADDSADAQQAMRETVREINEVFNAYHRMKTGEKMLRTEPITIEE